LHNNRESGLGSIRKYLFKPAFYHFVSLKDKVVRTLSTSLFSSTQAESPERSITHAIELPSRTKISNKYSNNDLFIAFFLELPNNAALISAENNAGNELMSIT